MKKNGFTLVELLAVIIILSVIALITTISVTSILANTEESLNDVQIAKIEEAAQIYYIKEGVNSGVSCVNLSDLIDLGYIQSDVVKDIEKRDDMNGSVDISESSNHTTYIYKETTCTNN